MATKKNSPKACGVRETETCTKTTEYGSFACHIEPGSRLYLGGRYIWKFADPLEWNKRTAYEYMTVVQHEAYSYVSKKAVPANIDITNEDFWMLIADPNAQMEELRQAFESAMREIEGVKEYVDTKTDEITEYVNEQVQEMRQYVDDNVETKSRKIVVIGDSWSDPNSVTVEDGVNWISIWKQVYQGDEFYNFAKSGRGFVTGNPNFQAQIDNAVNDETFNNEDVDLVFIVGAINDWTAGIHDASQYTTELRYCAQKIANNFVNAKPYVFFASCARPLCANSNVSGNWGDLLKLNTDLCRFVNTTMGSSLDQQNRLERKMQAFNITHCFTEQTFKPWGSSDYMRHLSKYGHWQLFKAINHVMYTGEEPEMFFNVSKYQTQNENFDTVSIMGKYTPLTVDMYVKLKVPNEISTTGQEYLEIPNDAFKVQDSATPHNFMGNWSDVFPPSVNTGNDAPLRYNSTFDYSPILQNAFNAYINRDRYPGNERIYVFAGTPVAFPSFAQGLVVKHASTSNPTRSGTYFAELHYDFARMSEFYNYFV